MSHTRSRGFPTLDRRPRRAVRLVAAAGALTLALFAGNTGYTNTQASSISRSAAGAPSGSLVVDSAFAFTSKDADPARGGVDFTATPVFHAMYDTLVTFRGGKYNKPVPSLASSYKVSKNARTFTFTIRKGVKFSNGDPLTANDVVFSFLRLENIKDTPVYLMVGITSITAPNKYTVVIKTSAPNPSLPFILTNPALSVTDAKELKAHGGTDAADASTTDSATAWLDTTSAGTGPYMLKSFSAAAQVTMVPNPRYWGPNKPHFKTIVYRAVDPATQALDIQRGSNEVALDIPTQQASTMKSNKKLQVQLFSNPVFDFLYVSSNTATSSVTANKDIQNAIRYGLDYNGIVKVSGPGATRSPGVVPTGFLGALKATQGIKRNVALAKKDVKASGISSPTFDLAYSTGGSTLTAVIAAKVQSSLAQVGITVNLTPQAAIIATQNYRGAKNQAGVFGWAPDYPDPNDYLAFLPGQLVGLRAGWPATAAPSIVKLGDKAGSTAKNKTRGELFRQLQTQLNLKSPIYPLVHPGESIVASSTLKNVAYSSVWYLDFAQISPA
jgi:peptide/nickel transport system substrate-binding protein